VNRIVQFDSPFLLGFEPTRLLIERIAKAANETYPPYNVESVGENRLRITLAVAGFSAGELEVRIEERQLIVAGKREAAESDAERDFLHRGIAARSFIRAFVLADGLDVEAARLEHGLLHIDLFRPEPETRIRRIPIERAEKAAERA
jgi:HSP20 family molecular chaperone IbpA